MKCSYLFTFLALLSLWGLFTCSEGSIEDQIGPLTSELWDKVADGWSFIISGNLNDFFLRYVNIDRDFFNLLELEFTSGNKNWIKDFLDLGMTLAESRAYFRLLDVYEGTFGTFIRTLTIEDMDKIVSLCEKLSESNTGILNKDQFVNGLTEVVFKGAGTALLFVAYKTQPEIRPIGSDHITKEEFDDMVHDMDVNDDGEITSSEMGSFWSSGNYGNEDTGELLFKQLDYNEDGAILVGEMDKLFEDLDCRNGGNGQVDFKEFMQLDLILWGLKDYPNGKCTTDYTDFY